MSGDNSGIENGFDPAAEAQELLAKIEQAKKLAAQFNAEHNDGGKTFHEVYVAGKVEPWHPRDRGGKHLGWAIYPVDPVLGKDEGGTYKQVEAVAFEDLDNKTPKTGDMIHVKRDRNWVGRRLSIEILSDSNE